MHQDKMDRSGKAYKEKEIESLEERYKGESGVFTSLDYDDGPGPCRSIEGWLVMITGVHEEAQEDDIYDAFSKFGPIKNLHLNLDRRSGYAKGYALVEYSDFKQAQKAIDEMNGFTLYEKELCVDWAFKKPVKKNTRKSKKEKD